MPDLVPNGGIPIQVDPPPLPGITLAPPSAVPARIEPPAPSIVAAVPSSTVTLVPVAGPAGPTGSTYAFTQGAPASSWTIAHNLGTYPPVVVLLDDDPLRPIWTDVEYTDLNTLVLTFPSPASGRAYL